MWKDRNPADGLQRAGFLLIEVLVAVMVVSLMLVVILRSFTNIWANVSAVRDDAEVVIVARAVLEAATSPRSRIAAGVQTGNSGAYSWKVTTIPNPVPRATPPSAQVLTVAPAKAPPGSSPEWQWELYRLTVEVTSQRNRSVTLDTFQLGAPPRQ